MVIIVSATAQSKTGILIEWTPVLGRPNRYLKGQLSIFIGTENEKME